MKTLLVSKWGDSLDVAYQLLKEGHEVKMYIQDKINREIGYGFVQKTNHWERFIEWADLIIFDYTGFGSIADTRRKQGKNVFGGSDTADDLNRCISDELDCGGNLFNYGSSYSVIYGIGRHEGRGCKP